MKAENILSKAELTRYSRHLSLPHFHQAGQEKLKKAKVLVVGAGGLGSPLLLYLAAAGIGKIGIVDFDRVEESNLQRQVLFEMKDLGEFKALKAKERIQKLNPHVEVETYVEPLHRENAFKIIRDYDVVADGSDNFPTRYLVNDACVLLGKVLVYGSIFRYEGQASVFNFTDAEGKVGPNYRDIFPEPPHPDSVPNCAQGGVLGVLPGILGSVQANEVIKIISGVGQTLSGRLFIFDAAGMESRTFKIRPNPQNPLNGENPTIHALIDYQEFCNPKPNTPMQVKSINVQELKKMMDEGADFQLIDVREPHEYEAANLNGELIPLGEIEEHVDKIDKNKQVVVHCRSGARSTNAIKHLQSKHGYENLYNLEGGILAWADQIDSSN